MYCYAGVLPSSHNDGAIIVYESTVYESKNDSESILQLHRLQKFRLSLIETKIYSAN